MNANSVVTVLPITNAPARLSRSTTTASRSGRWPAKIGEPISVGRSARRDDVLHADWNAVEHAELGSARASAITLVCAGERARFIECRPRLDLRIARADSREQLLGIGARGEATCCHLAHGVTQAQCHLRRFSHTYGFKRLGAS